MFGGVVVGCGDVECVVVDELVKFVGCIELVEKFDIVVGFELFFY